MTTLLGIAGAAGLFILLGFAATRRGSRLGSGAQCQGDSCTLDSCTLHDDAGETCGEHKSPSGWWPDDAVTHGEQR